NSATRARLKPRLRPLAAARRLRSRNHMATVWPNAVASWIGVRRAGSSDADVIATQGSLQGWSALNVAARAQIRGDSTVGDLAPPGREGSIASQRRPTAG